MKFLLTGRAILFAFISFFFSITSSKAQQCENGMTALTLSYDTLFRGGGNESYNFGFPRFDTSYIFHFPLFDPSKGTLIKVDIQTMISVKYSYTLENATNVPLTYTILMNRSDVFTCSALAAPVQNDIIRRTVATHRLNASDGTTGSGADFVSAGPSFKYENYPINYSFSNNIAGFLGNGNVSFDYQTITDLYPSGSSYYLWNPVTSDSVYFKMTYYYCLSSALPAGITHFTASRLSSGNIQLNWLAPNDDAGKTYVVEKSTNGAAYTAVASVAWNGNASNHYATQYTPATNDKKRLFFRIKVTEKNGSSKYSAVKDVSMPNENDGMMKVYPTVSTDAVSIYFPSGVKGDYLVNIRSVTGQIVHQSSFSNASNMKVAFNKKLPAGFYVVEAINKKTSESQLSKIIVQ